MEHEKLRTKLLAAARSHPPSDAVPYAFEQRIMAGLRRRAAEDPWTLWGRWLWRSAISFSALAIACGVWRFGPMDASLARAGEDDLSAHLEESLYASIADHADEVEEVW
jgi:hypothetical protein